MSQLANIQNHAMGEIALAGTCIAMGVSKIFELFVKAEPALASLSYIVAIVAGSITIYYKIKKKG
jgi:hypothetical protein